MNSHRLAANVTVRVLTNRAGIEPGTTGIIVRRFKQFDFFMFEVKLENGSVVAFENHELSTRLVTEERTLS